MGLKKYMNACLLIWGNVPSIIQKTIILYCFNYIINGNCMCLLFRIEHFIISFFRNTICISIVESMPTITNYAVYGYLPLSDGDFIHREREIRRIFSDNCILSSQRTGSDQIHVRKKQTIYILFIMLII